MHTSLSPLLSHTLLCTSSPSSHWLFCEGEGFILPSCSLPERPQHTHLSVHYTFSSWTNLAGGEHSSLAEGHMTVTSLHPPLTHSAPCHTSITHNFTETTRQKTLQTRYGLQIHWRPARSDEVAESSISPLGIHSRAQNLPLVSAMSGLAQC